MAVPPVPSRRVNRTEPPKQNHGKMWGELEDTRRPDQIRDLFDKAVIRIKNHCRITLFQSLYKVKIAVSTQLKASMAQPTERA